VTTCGTEASKWLELAFAARVLTGLSPTLPVSAEVIELFCVLWPGTDPQTNGERWLELAFANRAPNSMWIA